MMKAKDANQPLWDLPYTVRHELLFKINVKRHTPVHKHFHNFVPNSIMWWKLFVSLYFCNLCSSSIRGAELKFADCIMVHPALGIIKDKSRKINCGNRAYDTRCTQSRWWSRVYNAMNNCSLFWARRGVSGGRSWLSVVFKHRRI